MSGINFSTDQVKSIVDKLTKGRFEKFGTILDVATFIWDVVNDIIDNANDKNLTLQQKEDVAVGIALCVVSELETKDLISKELADKLRNLINSTDVFLDILIGIYNVIAAKQVANTLCGFLGLNICTSKSAVKAEIPRSVKVEEIVEVAGTGLVPEVKIEETFVDAMPDLEPDKDECSTTEATDA